MLVTESKSSDLTTLNESAHTDEDESTRLLRKSTKDNDDDIYNENNDGAQTFKFALATAYSFGVILIIVFGCVAWILYRNVDFVMDTGTGKVAESCTEHVCQNILENLTSSPRFKFLGCLLVLSTIPSYILILTPAR